MLSETVLSESGTLVKTAATVEDTLGLKINIRSFSEQVRVLR